MSRYCILGLHKSQVGEALLAMGPKATARMIPERYPGDGEANGYRFRMDWQADNQEEADRQAKALARFLDVTMGMRK